MSWFRRTCRWVGLTPDGEADCPHPPIYDGYCSRHAVIVNQRISD